jgi:hypothetical protein
LCTSSVVTPTISPVQSRREPPASLREIDRRRSVLAETLRRAVQELEERQRKLLERPANTESLKS